jgi:hypothetical protein
VEAIAVVRARLLISDHHTNKITQMIGAKTSNPGAVITISFGLATPA